MNIFDLITANEIAVYWNEGAQDRQPFWGESRFPNRKKRGLSLTWINGRSGRPVVLNPSAFDVHVLPRVREGFNRHAAEMPFFKESYYIDEETRQEIMALTEGSNQAVIDTVLTRVFDDTAKLLESAAVTRERMRMLALTTGVVAFNGNGQAFEFDYGLLPEQLINASTPWTNTVTSDPLLDIQTALDYQEFTNGVVLTTALMNLVTYRLLLASEKIKNEIYLINAFVNSTGTLTPTQLNSFVAERAGLTIEVYNKKYINEQGVTVDYVADNIVVFMPDGNLGYTWFGTTPEEADLLYRGVSNVSVVDVGVAITTMVKEDPVSVETKVSQITLPSFEEAEKIVILDVA